MTKIIEIKWTLHNNMKEGYTTTTTVHEIVQQGFTKSLLYYSTDLHMYKRPSMQSNYNHQSVMAFSLFLKFLILKAKAFTVHDEL